MVFPVIRPLERMVVVPSSSSASPVILAELMTVPSVCVRLKADPDVRFAEPPLTVRSPSEAALNREPLDTSVVAADPPVRLAVPPLTERFARVTFDRNVLPVTLVWPETVPPVRTVVPLVFKALRLPPVRFSDPSLIVGPTDPPEIFAVPLEPMDKASKFMLERRSPVTTLASP